MITITASKEFEWDIHQLSQEVLSANIMDAWDYLFTNGENHVFLVDTDGGFLVLDETLRLENALLFQCADIFLDWLRDINIELQLKEMRKCTEQ